MDAQRQPLPGPKNTDHSSLHSTHAIPHSASEPPNSSSSTSSNGPLHVAAAVHEHADGDAVPPSLKKDELSPPPQSPIAQEASSTLRPTGPSREREVATYTAAAAVRGRNLDKHGNFDSDFDPNPRPSLASSAGSPVTLIKNLPDALNTTITAPGRTLDTIKAKLQAPSTGQKSKSDIPSSIAQIEHDLRCNQEAPGNLSPIKSPTSPAAKVGDAEKDGKPAKSSSFSSLLGGKNKKSNPVSVLMQRGPRKSESSAWSGSALSPLPLRRGVSEEGDGEQGQGNRLREEEEEEDEGIVRQRIKDQQKRLEDLDEAQTMGLLRTQQEGGIEPPGSPSSPTAKPSWPVALPLFGNKHGKAKDESADAGEEGSRGRSDTPHRANSEKLKSTINRSQSHGRSASASRAARSRSRPREDGTPRRRGSGKLEPPQRNSTTWTSKLRTKIPIKEFPLQGSGAESEFNQECPLWARQPWKYLYFSYFGLSVGFFYLPRWAITSAFPSHRGRKDWSWKKATMVKLYRHGTQLTFRTRTSLGRDLQKEVPHSKTVRCKFTWVDPVGEEDVRGELRRAMVMQKVQPQRTCGFWYGDVAEQAKHRHRHGFMSRHRHGSNQTGASDTPMQENGVSPGVESSASFGAGSEGELGEAKGGVGRPAEPGEKVLFHLHGGAYWIGTAHEKDVTAAVNTEPLQYMAEIYRAKEAQANVASSSSSSSSSGSTPYQGKLLRSFSLDYRLCVPGRPRAGSYPAALLDALSGYLYLVRQLGFKEENIIVAGDSAGGNLALALCRYLRDERESIAKQPGSLLLMSPWVDVSRSHSGPTGAPNLDSTVYTNQKSDIISSMLAFRNTAVSAFLGDLPARETYRNPYISPVSLQLPLERGGKGPHYGFHGFPKRIYITSGSAEISYDQHLTLAHRLASGTKKGRPTYTGDKLSAGCNARELAERRNRPRPKEMLDSEQGEIGVNPQGYDLKLTQSSQGVTEGLAEGVAGGVIDGEPNHSTVKQQNGPQNGEGNGEGKGKRPVANPPPEPEDREDREVIFDEVKDAVHDYLLFKWFEPERSGTWRRIARWIDEGP